MNTDSSVRKRILIADDDGEHLEMTRMFLASLGYEVLTAGDGLEALRLARTQAPDLILLDVMMPRMDGHHVAFELCIGKGKKAPKVLIVTARDLKEEETLALLNGALGTIHKPFKLDDLEARIVEALNAETADSRQLPLTHQR